MPDQKPTLDYARPRPKPPTDWDKIIWTVLAFVFLAMCLLIAAIFSRRWG